MASHLPIGSLKTCSGLEPVPRCKTSPLADDITTAPSGPVNLLVQPLSIPGRVNLLVQPLSSPGRVNLVWVNGSRL